MATGKDTMNIMSFILGNESKVIGQNNDSKIIKRQKISRQLILNSAMFWDNKKRVQKIKTLFLNNIGLIEFDDTQDFKIEQLESIELLSLSKNSFIHLHPLIHLQTLISLNISHNKIYDLNPLSNLLRLQQLYASSNKIKNIQPLSKLTELKILILYKNLIRRQKQQETFIVLGGLHKLQQIDLQQNQVADDSQYVQLLRTLTWIKKINGNLNKNTQKIKQMSSSKAFGLTSTKSFNKNTSLMFYNTNINNNQSNFIDTKTTFYNFNKKKNQLNSSHHSSNNNKDNLQQKQNILNKLQSSYAQLDQQFQQSIINNVEMKSKLYKIIQQKKLSLIQQQDNQYKKQQIQNLKRKVKAMKQHLFTKNKKGDLLRKLFQFEIMAKQIKQQKNLIKQSIQTQINKIPLQNNNNKQIQWTRRFEPDQVIVIERNQKYLFDQQQQINDLLGNFEQTLKDIKSELDYLS